MSTFVAVALGTVVGHIVIDLASKERFQAFQARRLDRLADRRQRHQDQLLNAALGY